MNFLLAASLDAATIKVIIIAGFILISVISSLVKKLQQKADGPPAPRPPGRPPPSPAENWEAQLKRLLEGEDAAPPRPAPPMPPPIPAAPPRAEPKPVPRPRVVVVEKNEQDEGLRVPMPTFVESARAHERAEQSDDRANERLRLGSSMATASAAYHHASQLDVRMAEHMQEVREQVGKFTEAKRARAVSPEAAQAVALVRNPQSVRAALVASMILGPPKALAEAGRAG